MYLPPFIDEDFQTLKLKYVDFFLFLIRVYDQKYLSYLKVDGRSDEYFVEHPASLIGCVRNVEV